MSNTGKVTPRTTGTPRAPQRSESARAAEIVESNAANDAAKARQLQDDGDTKRGVKDEPGAGNSRTGVDGLPIR